MDFRRFRPFLASALLLGLSAGLTLFAQDSTTHRGRKYKAPPPTSRIDVTILRNDDGKPIENAAVVFQVEGDKGNMELKTNEDGKASIDVLPTGSKVLLQVIAKGYKTFGGDYTIDKAAMTFEVKLKRPGQQYSIYDNHPEAAKSGDGGTKDKPADSSKKDGSQSGPQDGSKEPPAESANQSDSKPNSSQPQPQ
jgi:Carboxypeptidase regulatory-like domain